MVEVQVMVLVLDHLHHLLCYQQVQVWEQVWEQEQGQELGQDWELVYHCYLLFYQFNLIHCHLKHHYHQYFLLLDFIIKFNFNFKYHLTNHHLLDPINLLVLVGYLVIRSLLLIQIFKHFKLIIRSLLVYGVFNSMNYLPNFLEIKIIFRIIKHLPYFVFFSFFHSFSRYSSWNFVHLISICNFYGVNSYVATFNRIYHELGGVL